MNQRLTKYKMWICIMVAALLLSGCSGKGELPQLAGEESQETGVYYQIHETVLPDPNEELSLTLTDEERIIEVDMLVEDGTIYRFTRRIEFLEENVLWVKEYYFQSLSAPYTSWETVSVPMDYWSSYRFEQLVREDGEKILCVVSKGSTDPNKEAESYLGIYDKKGTGELLGQLPASNLQWYVTPEEEMYGYPILPGSDLVFVDADYSGVQEKNVNGKIYGLYQMQDTGEVYWYGEKSDGYGCWNIENGSPLYQGIQDITFLETATLTPRKKAFFADLNGIWEYSTENPKGAQIVNFFDRYYILEEIVSITATGEDELSLLVKMDGEYMILQIVKTDEIPTAKQQIVLATFFDKDIILNDLIAQFNRQSDLYEVVPLYPEKGQDGFAFADKIQMEMAAGRGPDLLPGDLLSMDSMARNGYLHNLDGLLEDEEYWEDALEYGKIDDVLYGMPYEVYLHSASYSQELTGGRSRWTLEEFMEAVRASKAEILQQGFDGMDIVIYYGLLDNSNKEFIDWEQGISHLNEEAFLEFLQFAYEYMDRGEIAAEDFGEAIRDGRIAAVSGPYYFSYLNYLKECFQGKDSNIGFPRAEGNGIYVTANMMFVNSNSTVAEGAKEFLKFITSKDMQYRMVEKNDGNRFPIHLGAMERQIELKKQEKESELLAKMNGVDFQYYGLQEEREEVLRFLLEHSQARGKKEEPILDIFSEELEPFFAGACTAKEAVDKLHSRVQLYLDERQ